MTNNKLGLLSRADNARPIQIMHIDDRTSAAAFDEGIRAQLIHVVIGVGGTGSQTVRMLIDLSVSLSLDDVYTPMQGSLKHGNLFLPAGSHAKRAAAHDADEWLGVCTQVRMCGGTQSDLMHSMIGEPLTLRLVFDAFSERQASDLAELLCTHFSARHVAMTSLRETMAALRTTLLDPQRPRCFTCMPLSYRSASVFKGWRGRIGDPVCLLGANATDDGWREPHVPTELSELFAQRCEAAWYEAEALKAPEPHDEEPAAESEDLSKSSDAADDFVCADRMLSLWYGQRRRRRRS
ncbi:hypothetical protein [Mesorhizobium sp. IMUNJ 23232]|uniref:hypothetical protein n=1 Tax=Mesorhizobium sp. IMUNJ 23232 TaxID=3376064 RepID=UPI00378CD2CD